MSSPSTILVATRAALVDAVITASRNSSTTAVFFHTAMAEQVGLNATDEKTLFILSELGPLTAGDIAHHTGLTTASVTALIDRLEKKGFVRRVRDPNDRRRVIVEPDAAKLAELEQLFDSISGTMSDLLAGYTDGELAAIADYLNRAAEASRAIAEKLGKQQSGEQRGERGETATT